jgi:uncharacterized protein (DUF1501 family)
MKVMSFSRREFLSLAAGAALAGVAGLGAPRLAQGAEGYKALVCIFLNGGNDAWNSVAPVSETEFSAYAKARGLGESWGLALEKNQFLAMGRRDSGRIAGAYGMHPSLANCHSLYEAGELAVVSGLGPLVKPTTKLLYEESIRLAMNGLPASHPLPSGLFGHNTQATQWHCLNGDGSSPTGWAGRILDELESTTSLQQLPASVSTNGRPALMVGNRNIPYVIDPNGIQRFEGITEGQLSSSRRIAFERIMRQTTENNGRTLYERGFAQVQASALENALRFQQALSSAPSFAGLPEGQGDGLATQLRTVAKIISARNDFDVARQIFFVEDIGFDTHDKQNTKQPQLLSELDAAVGGFASALKTMGVWDQVVTFTQSDFGRTLTSNGDGSDHAWSGLQLVMGGATRGGDIYGTYPILELGRDNEIGGGIFIPDISVDQYAATIARWFGVADRNLDTICPHLANFSERDLGFLDS